MQIRQNAALFAQFDKIAHFAVLNLETKLIKKLRNKDFLGLAGSARNLLRTAKKLTAIGVANAKQSE